MNIDNYLITASDIMGPYETDPHNLILTSIVTDGTEGSTKAADNLKYYNPNVVLQKAGHASLVETSNKKCYAVHLCARPFLPELRCTLGRETAIQEMEWTADGWLRKKTGSPLPALECEESGLPEVCMPQVPDRDELGQPLIQPNFQMNIVVFLQERWLELLVRMVYSEVNMRTLISLKQSNWKNVNNHY